MKNQQKKYFEVEVLHNGENLLLTNYLRSPLVKFDIFAMTDYRRTVVTLCGGEDTTLQSAKLFLDCEILQDTILVASKEEIHYCETTQTTSTEKKKNLLEKIIAFFKGETAPTAVLRSSSFLCLKNGENYHFVGAIAEENGLIDLDVLPEQGAVVAKLSASNIPVWQDRLLFDVVQIEGDREFVLQTFCKLSADLYHILPRESTQIPIIETTLNMAKTDDVHKIFCHAEDTSFGVFSGEAFCEFSLLQYVEKARPIMQRVMENLAENIIPIAEISPFVIKKDSPEFNAMNYSLIKTPTGKNFSYQKNGQTLYVFDVFSQEFVEYLKSAIASLFEMGFCGVKFLHLDAICKASREGMSSGECAKAGYQLLSQCCDGKISFASDARYSIASGLFDYFIFAKDAKIWEDSENAFAPIYDFSPFSSLIKYRHLSKYFGNVAPISVPCEILNYSEEAFDLCNIANMFFAKSISLKNPTPASISRANEFAFLRDVEIEDVIEIQDGRFAIVFFFEETASVCLFNFQQTPWEIEENIVPAYSASFKE